MSESTALLDSLRSDDSWTRHQTLERLRADGVGPDALAVLREALDDPVSDRRAAARMALAALASPGSPDEERALDGLRHDLRADSTDRRLLAASALGETGNPEAGPALIDALEDPAPNVAAAAADALGELGYGPGREPLEGLARSGEFWLRAAAVVALGRIGDERAVATLERLAAEDTDLDRPLIEALSRIGAPRGLDALGGLAAREPFRASLAAGAILCAHPETEPPGWLTERARDLVPRLRDRLRTEESPETARLLGLAATPESAGTLLDLVDPPRRSDAAFAGLAALPEELRGPAILERVVDAEPGQAAALLSLLPPVRGRDAVATIVPLLSAEDEALRAAAAEALARAPASEALPVLVEALGRPDAPPAVIQALGGLGSAACGALDPLLDDPSPEVRLAAAAALARCADASVSGRVERAYREESHEEVRRALLKTMAGLEGGDAVPVLAEALRSAEPGDRLAAIEALGLTRSARAVPELAGVMERGERVETLLAVRSLGQLDAPEAFEPLRSWVGREDLDLRRSVARALAGLPGSHPAEPFLELLRDDDDWVRVFAIRGLARRESDAARERLESLAEVDPSRHVRDEARKALRDS